MQNMVLKMDQANNRSVPSRLKEVPPGCFEVYEVLEPLCSWLRKASLLEWESASFSQQGHYYKMFDGLLFELLSKWSILGSSLQEGVR